MGEESLNLFHATIQLGSKPALTLQNKAGRKFTLTPIPKTKQAHLSPAMSCLITPKAMRKECKKRNTPVFMMLVRADTPKQPPMEIPPVSPELRTLIQEYHDIFQEPTGLPPHRPPEQELAPLVPAARQIPYRKPYRLSPAEMKEAEERIAEFLERGWIRPSTSPYGAPILFAPKPDGTLRMCIDYRPLNALTVRYRHPIPRMDDLFDKLGKARYFTSLDLRHGYHQMRIPEPDIPKTAFTTPFGHFEYLVLPMGVCNGPSVFQAMMEHILEPHVYKFLALYLDDILIFSDTLEEHLKHIEHVFALLRKHGLRCRLVKCEFEKPELKYLGHILGNGQIRMNPAKISAVREWPAPTSVKELRSFLGLATYFRRYIQGHASLVAPLTSLLVESNEWTWGPEHAVCFQLVKEALTSPPVLALPDLSLPFDVICDASINGVGGVLVQGNHPVAYYSRKFSRTERNYSTGEQELYAIYLTLQEWRCYLEGPKIRLITDHCPLTYLKTQQHLSRKQARWLTFFEQFDYTWVYRPGRTNVADPLSRHPTFAALIAEDQELPDPPSVMQEIAEAYEADTAFADTDFLQRYHISKDGQGLFIRNPPGDEGDPCTVVPNVRSIRQRIIESHHDTRLSGHQGRDRTLDLIRRHFWWLSMSADVEEYINSCPQCQRTKSTNQPTHGLLQPIDIPTEPWEDVSVDFCCGLRPSAAGFDSILVFIDRLTKMVILVPSKITCTAKQFAQLFLEHVVQHHGVPKLLLSDRGPQFNGKFLKAFAKLIGCQSRMTTSHRPSTNGLVERVNRVVEEILRAYVSNIPDDWDTLLPVAAFAMNNSKHSATGFSPFYLNYGRHPHTPFTRVIRHYTIQNCRIPAAASRIKLIHEALATAKDCIQRAQQRMTDAYNQHKVDVQFAVNDYVYMNAKNLKRGAGVKLLPDILVRTRLLN